MKRRHIVLLGILAVLVLAVLIYTRPMTLEALCEADITQCQSVFGYHFRAPQVEDTRFEFPSNDTRCAQLTALFAQQKFRRSLANLLPQGGTTHRTQDGDFRWEVGFCFDATDFPTAARAKACSSSAGTFTASYRFSALTMVSPSAAPCKIRTHFYSRSMASSLPNRNTPHFIFNRRNHHEKVHLSFHHRFCRPRGGSRRFRCP